jgi:lipopolysaccharide transport system ATP-binding protein
MNDIVIKINNISKKYKLGQRQPYKTIRESIANLIKKPVNRISSIPYQKNDLPQEIWALKDVSLDICKGDVVGIIGRNGAGKSTLLKILARITQPTEGIIELKGRVGSLLEVGTGFHPELTGHENIYLYGAILGMNRLEITRKFKEIVEFSELQDFIETPVKRYSSGMYMRLAFAVAAHLEPEILLVDEVLAVGDAAFQKKCLGKMDEVSKGGRTVLFVSHNMSSIQRLCNSAVLLEKGKIISVGKPSEVTELYLSKGATSKLEWKRETSANANAFFKRIYIKNIDGKISEYVTTTDALCIVLEFLINKHSENLQLSVGLLDRMGDIIFSTSPSDLKLKIPDSKGLYHAEVRFPKEILLPTTYGIRAVLWHPNFGIYDANEELRFLVQETDSYITQTPLGRSGKIAMYCDWNIQREG